MLFSPEKKLIIRKNKYGKYFEYLIHLLSIPLGIYAFIEYPSIWTAILLFFFFFSFPHVINYTFNQYKKSPDVLMKVDENGIWTSKMGFEKWPTIKKIIFRYRKRGKYSKLHIDIYQSKENHPDETINDFEIYDTFDFTLKRTLKLYTKVESVYE